MPSSEYYTILSDMAINLWPGSDSPVHHFPIFSCHSFTCLMQTYYQKVLKVVIERGPGILAIVWIGSSARSYPLPLPVSKLSLFLNLPVCRQWGGGGRIYQTIYGRQKAWPSINNLKLSVTTCIHYTVRSAHSWEPGAPCLKVFFFFSNDINCWRKFGAYLA